MSRIQKYRDSIKNFVNNRCCLIDVKDNTVKNFITGKIGDDNYILSILFLTMVNSQNKKNKTLYQSYHAAIGLEFLRIYIDMNINQKEYIKKLNSDIYIKISNMLIMLCMNSWNNNISIIKKKVDAIVINNIYYNFINLLANKINYDNLLKPIELKLNEKKTCDLQRFYFKNNKTLYNKFLNIKQYDKKTSDNILNIKSVKLSEFVMECSWLFGCGQKEFSNNVSIIGKSFGIMYQLSKDFSSLDKDISNASNTSYNYVINNGLQESYEKFLENKQIFIENTMMLGIFSNTVKEMIDAIEKNVDDIINSTQTDLKSTYSTVC